MSDMIKLTGTLTVGETFQKMMDMGYIVTGKKVNGEYKVTAKLPKEKKSNGISK